MILDGERAFENSQEDPGVAASSALTDLHALNNNNMTATNPDSRAETSRHSRVTSLEGWILVFSPPDFSH